MAVRLLSDTYFLNKDPVAANYTSFILTSKAAGKLASGPPVWEAFHFCERQAHCKWYMSCPSQRWDLRSKMGHFSSSMLHFYQNPHQNKPSPTWETLGSLNKTNSTLSGMRYMSSEIASPTSSSWDPLQPHQKYKTSAPPPNQGQQCSTPRGIKSQLPHEPKASAWKRRRRKAKLFFRVITEDSNRGLSGSCALVLSLPSLPCQVPEHKKDQDKLNHI